MNMYTRPEHRRKGIAYKTLDILVRASKDRGITVISLEATDMGRGLYEKYGFEKMSHEMELLNYPLCYFDAICTKTIEMPMTYRYYEKI